MRALRILIGVVALLALVVALNVLVVKENVFLPAVWVPLAVAVVAGVIWLGMRLAGLAGAVSRGRSMAGLNLAVQAVIVLGICITLYAFAAQWDQTWDLTREGRRELSDLTKQVLRGLQEDVEVYGFFVASDDPQLATTRRKTAEFLERVESHTDRLTWEFIDPVTQPERIAGIGVSGQVPPRGAVAIVSGANKRFLAISEATGRLEERDFTNALINVVREARPVVYFLTGHGEGSITSQQPNVGASQLAAALRQEVYSVEELALTQADPRVPGDASVVVIHNLETDLAAHEIAGLDAFIAGGGRLLVMLDAIPRLEIGMPRLARFREWAQRRLGVDIGHNLIITERVYSRDPTVVQLMPDFGLFPGFAEMSDEYADLEMRGSYPDNHPITRGFEQTMIFPLARSVALSERRPEGAGGIQILWTPPMYWAETNVDFLLERQHAAFDEGEDIDGPVPVGAAVAVRTEADTVGERAAEARAVVLGNAAFASNEGLLALGHRSFVLNTIAWLTEQEDLIAIRPTGELEEPILLTRGQEQLVAWVGTLGVLQAIVLVGVGVHLYRRRYQ